jgi:hypothetical protein
MGHLPPGPPSLIGFEVRAMSIYGFQFPKHLMAAMGWFWGLKRMSFDSFDSKRPKILTGTGNTQLLQQLSTFLIGLVKVTVTVLKLSIISFSFFFDMFRYCYVSLDQKKCQQIFLRVIF